MTHEQEDKAQAPPCVDATTTTTAQEKPVTMSTVMQPTDESALRWHCLQNVTYMANTPDEMLLGRQDMTPAWRLFLFGNGSPTHHLGLLTGHLTEVDVLGHESLDISDDDGAPAPITAIVAPRCRRQVFLRNTAGQRLGYASSWFHDEDMGRVFKDQKQPIGKNILQHKTELFRDMKTVFCGSSPALARAFGHDGPFWGRSYLFWKGGRPVTFIYEVFSPELEVFMGPVLMQKDCSRV